MNINDPHFVCREPLNRHGRKSKGLTNDAVSLVQLVGGAHAAVGVEVGEAGQPHSGVRVREGEGDAVRARLWDGRPAFGLWVHRVWRLRRTVHPGGRQGVLVVAPGDLWEYEKKKKRRRQRETRSRARSRPGHMGRKERVRWSERSHVTFKAKIFAVQTEISCRQSLKERG